jgi:hypothetical protein
MRVAIQNPMFLYGDMARNYTGYTVEFARLAKPVIYLPGLKNWLSRGAAFKYRLQTKSAMFGIRDFDFAFSEAELNRKADVLVCFNGFPYRELDRPARGFRGLKVYHAFEFVFRAAEANRWFDWGGVDYLMGYADHWRHSAFFRNTYPRYSGKMIPVPFGFGARFKGGRAPEERIPKVVAAGAVNPVDDPTVEDRQALADYREHYRDEQWTHRWRQALRENSGSLHDILDSFLPVPPKTNNHDYDAVEIMRNYAMFANDEGLMAFPPARTYEGTAAGAVMVANDHECFRDLGFADGENCILHRPLDVDDFRGKVEWYRERPEELRRLAANSTELVWSRYSHRKIAETLFNDIRSKLNS